MYYNSLDPHSDPNQGGVTVPTWAGEKMKHKEVTEACPRLHSQYMAESGFKPLQSVSSICHSILVVLGIPRELLEMHTF